MRLKVLIIGLLAGLAMAMPAHAQDSPFVGQIDIVGFNFAPVGWAECDGQLLPISQYEVLFNLIGTTYGGDGQNTFALPDLRGRMAIHQGEGAGLAPYVIGQMGGEETVTLTINQIPAHSHAVLAGGAADSLSPSDTTWGSSPTNLYSSTGASPVAMSGATIGAAGGGQPHNNIPPYLTINFIISLFGIYPSQG